MTVREDPQATTDIAFTPAVKRMQERLGSRTQMERMSAHGGFRHAIGEDLVGFISRSTTAFLGTASADGRPYVQHRGGPPGFIEVEGAHDLLIRDYPGNRQYISLGNLSENDKAFLFLIDYESQTRIKLWGRARQHVAADGQRAIAFEVEAWDVNCPKYIPRLYSEATVAALTRRLTERIAELEARLAAHPSA